MQNVPIGAVAGLADLGGDTDQNGGSARGYLPGFAWFGARL